MSRSMSSTAAMSPNVLRSPTSEMSGGGAEAAGSAGGADCVAKRLLHDLETAVEVLVRRDERHEDAQHVAVKPAREEHQPALASIRGRLRGQVGRRCLLLRVVHEFQCEHRADTTHLAD